MSQPVPGPDDVAPLVNAIHPLLAGHNPLIIDAVLADLLAIWLIGWPDTMREELLATHLGLVRKLIVINDKRLYGPNGHPQNQRPQ